MLVIAVNGNDPFKTVVEGKVKRTDQALTVSRIPLV
jgi:hypothetical protein